MRVIGQAEVRAHLTYEVAIPIMRQAMIALSRGETRQLLRSIIPLDQGRMFGVMPGALGERACFGAKLVSVFPENFALGRQSHQGVVVLFDGERGVPLCVAHAGEITAIRTAAASAAASAALARPEAHRLALLGYGEQARTHLRAISQVRGLSDVRVWGRDFGRAQAFAAEMSAETGLAVRALAGARAAVEKADIICTLTSSKTPVMHGAWVSAGAHVNLVGSSYAGPVEVDHDLVVRARLIADSREGVLAQGAEVLAAKAAGLIDDAHVVGEIGEVFDGRLGGRQSPDQITAYKSLGHIVQDLASAQALMER
ncbi:MAG: ornithine cyclodeaminase/alanine dehydrogenase-like protein (mu-crystallin family) [Pseudoalteromonas distincta]|jgi:ornithine cyclodeaminase/alanine dehydrogenase-like protein (mu-crystallin family)